MCNFSSIGFVLAIAASVTKPLSRMKLFFSSILVLLFCSNCFSQDISFANLRNGATYLNPALTSLQGTSDVSFAYRNQWPALSGTYVTYYLGSSHYLQRANGVFGFNWMRDEGGPGAFVNDRFSLNYGQLLNIGKSGLVVKPAVEITYFESKIDLSRLVFGAGFLPRPGTAAPAPGANYPTSAKGIDVTAGFLAYHENFMFGSSMNHVNEPEQLLLGSTGKLPIRFSSHVSYYFALNEKRNIGVQPNLLYQEQQGFRFLQAGLSVYFKAVNLKVAVRNRDSFVASLGLDLKKFTFNYAYDITVSKLTRASAGSHEIGMAVRLFNDKPRHPKFVGVVPPLF